MENIRDKFKQDTSKYHKKCNSVNEKRGNF